MRLFRSLRAAVELVEAACREVDATDTCFSTGGFSTRSNPARSERGEGEDMGYNQPNKNFVPPRSSHVRVGYIIAAHRND
jgi:hypothetical protein